MTLSSDISAAAVALCAQRLYNFKGELGRGAFKSAYLASDNHGQFALKLALISGSADRLIRESIALQGCSHSSIAKLLQAYPYQHEALNFWVVQEEFLAGWTLEERLHLTTLSANDVRGMAISLTEVLVHLHERRLVHRDIKPANIMFREDRKTPVLTDFGVVRMLDQPSLTRDFLGSGPGTPAYASPEQLNNEKSQIDWRADQFGLGIVLSECLIGRHPFMASGQSLHEAIIAVASRKALPMQTQNELFDLGFQCLIQALQPWPVSRFRRPIDLLQAFTAV